MRKKQVVSRYWVCLAIKIHSLIKHSILALHTTFLLLFSFSFFDVEGKSSSNQKNLYPSFRSLNKVFSHHPHFFSFLSLSVFKKETKQCLSSFFHSQVSRGVNEASETERKSRIKERDPRIQGSSSVIPHWYPLTNIHSLFQSKQSPIQTVTNPVTHPQSGIFSSGIHSECSPESESSVSSAEDSTFWIIVTVCVLVTNRTIGWHESQISSDSPSPFTSWNKYQKKYQSWEKVSNWRRYQIVEGIKS